MTEIDTLQEVKPPQISQKLLIVEDDKGLANQLKWALSEHPLFVASNKGDAIALLRSEEPDVVTLDLGLPPDPDGTSEGFALLRDILALKPATKVIVVSGHTHRDSARQAVACGAWDFCEKPIEIEQLAQIIERAFRVQALENESHKLTIAQGHKWAEGLITGDPDMKDVCKMAERFAGTDISVLLQGASGTGKELLARALHSLSDRKNGPFIAVNCGAIPENLLEAELFGYEKGAFTGAVKTTPGKLELADGGTFFLDEVADLPMAIQGKLLRFLQDKSIDRLGSRKHISVDVRVCSATFTNLYDKTLDHSFRQDLYYRLAEVTIDIPRLADRPGDAVLLAQVFLAEQSAAFGRPLRHLTQDALEALNSHSWPGNVRELQNRIKRAVVMANGDKITAVELGLEGQGFDSNFLNLRRAREKTDRQMIGWALAQSEGNMSQASRLLGISRPTLYDLLRQYDMKH